MNMDGGMIALVVGVVFLVGMCVYLVTRPKVGLPELRRSLAVAKRDGKNPEDGIYWSDLFAANCAGVRNTVRDDIRQIKPTLDTEEKQARAMAKDTRDKGRKEANELKARATMVVIMAEKQAGKHEAIGVMAEKNLSEIAEIEEYISNL